MLLLSRRYLSKHELKYRERLAREHAENAYYETLKKELIRTEGIKSLQVRDWKIVGYFKQNFEKLIVFDTGTGYVLSVKGGGHPVVRFMYEDHRDFRKFVLMLVRSIGGKEDKYRRWSIPKRRKKEV